MKDVLLVLLVVVVSTIPSIYFLYCVEKKRKWALEVAKGLKFYTSFPF